MTTLPTLTAIVAALFVALSSALAAGLLVAASLVVLFGVRP
ncbi:hypothetical protein [Pseudonocardia sp. T1-2H]